MLSPFQTILFRNSPALAWAVLILLLCAIPGRQLPVISWAEAFALDKWVHALLFGILTFFLFRGNLPYKVPVYALLLLSFSLSAGYGWLTEWLQTIWFEGRKGDILDGLADTAGSLLAVAYIRLRFRAVFRKP